VAWVSAGSDSDNFYFVVGSTDPDALLGGRILATVSRGRVVFEAGG
jgi:hypothetical protein